MNAPYIVHRVNAGNDVNGNPRRLLIGQTATGELRIVDEGYNGDGPTFIAQAFGVDAVYSGLTIRTTPGEYRRLRKIGAS